MGDFCNRLGTPVDLDGKAPGDDDIKRFCAFAFSNDTCTALDGDGLKARFKQAQYFRGEISEGGDGRKGVGPKRHRGAAWQSSRALYHGDTTAMKALMSKMQKKLTGQRFEMLPLDYVVEPGFAAAAANVILTLTRQAIDWRSRWPSQSIVVAPFAGVTGAGARKMA
jgi:hypothetical protein